MLFDKDKGGGVCMLVLVLDLCTVSCRVDPMTWGDAIGSKMYLRG